VHRDGPDGPPDTRDRVAGQLRELDAIHTELPLIGDDTVVTAGGRL
jgi:hypothetical protein